MNNTGKNNACEAQWAPLFISPNLSSLAAPPRFHQADMLSQIYRRLVPRPCESLLLSPLRLMLALGSGFVRWPASSDEPEANDYSDCGAELFLPGDVEGISFDDVIGQPAGKKEMMGIVHIMQNREKFVAINARMPRGILLTGETGLGKTMIALAVATECGYPLLYISGAAFMEHYIGVGASRVRTLFKWGKELVEQFGGCFVFIDELDSVGARRGDDNGNEQVQTMTQLLSEMDGFTSGDGIVVITATNCPDELDPALKRRFDRKAEFVAPLVKDRLAILERKLEPEFRDRSVDLAAIAKMTPGATGAILGNIVNETKIACVEAGGPLLVTQAMLIAAEKKVTMGARREGFEIGRDQLLATARHEVGHLILALYGSGKVKGRMPVRLSILFQGDALGHLLQDWQETTSNTRDELILEMAVCLAGKVALEIFFDGLQNTGPTSDLEQATKIAVSMVGEYGMSKRFGNLSLSVLKGCGVTVAESVFFSEVQKLIAEAEKLARSVLKAHRHEFEILVVKLMEEEELLADRIREILGLPATAVDNT